MNRRGFLAFMAGLPAVGRLFSQKADPPYVYIGPKEPIWPDRCTCAMSVSEIGARFSATVTCPEHGGFWSYKCHACLAHVRASEAVAKNKVI
jgi:hypothetical protein